jgi:hypothetical protein
MSDAEGPRRSNCEDARANTGVKKPPWLHFCRRVVGIGVVALCAPALGHHSFADYYLEADTIEVEGEVIEFHHRNPHSWIHIMGQDAFGRPKPYAAEWASVSRLERDGITARTLRPGDVVRVWASPNRNPTDNRIRLKRIERRSDHWKWGGQNRGDDRGGADRLQK